MKKKSVTVLITVKNCRETIKNCIDSLLKLNYKNYKVYVVDAFSIDGTYEILKGYGKKIKLERHRGNPAQAYNYAIKKINTDFIAFTDGDCVVDRNWLKNLVSSFKSEEIGAVVGYCKTPKEVNFLQKLIGIELESRFKKFPKFISRGPTMNLCVRTKIAKELKFDERLFISYDTDFGYRLTASGKKIVYQPKALVYHYHRSTWKSFFKQQLIYGKFVPLLYLKHKKMVKGDHISKPLMMIQPLIFSLGILFFILSIFSQVFLMFGLLSFFILFLVYLVDFCSFNTKRYYFFPYLAIFSVRTIAWCIGLLLGIKNLIFNRKWRKSSF
jgi:cellulose synthase/poly-beta-1,6-N-acetylglucosamine synthase-like glycosyltransferase